MSPSPAFSLDLGLRGLTPETVRIGEESEAWGVDGVWFPEIDHDPFLPVPLLAERTERITLGTRIALAFPRSPMTLAYTAWDLARFTQGRFVLGLGTQVKGHNEKRFSVEWTSPGPRLREVIESLRHIWDVFQGRRDKLNYQGDCYSFSLMTDFFNPGPIDHPDIPLYIAGINPYHLRLAGEQCDGLHLHPFNTPSYTRNVVVDHVREGAERADRSLEDVTLTASPFLVTGPDQARRNRCREHIRQKVAFYGSTRTYSAVWEEMDRPEIGRKLHSMSIKGQWDRMPDRISDEVLREFTVDAPLDEVVPELEETYGEWVDRVVIPRDHHENDTLRQLARRFRKE